MVGLTDVQINVGRFILRKIREQGVPPTLREIATYFGWSAVGSAQDVVAALRKKGILLPQEAGKARQLIPADMAWEFLGISKSTGAPAATAGKNVEKKCFKGVLESVSAGMENFFFVPVLGTVEAGLPLEAIENTRDQIPFPRVAGKKAAGTFFALVVSGYSMLNAGFLPGDTLLIERVQDAHNGDIVVAKLDEEVTVKRFAVRGSFLYRQALEKINPSPSSLPPAFLVPENPEFSPIPFGDSEQHSIVGLVRSLYRGAIH